MGKYSIIFNRQKIFLSTVILGMALLLAACGKSNETAEVLNNEKTETVAEEENKEKSSEEQKDEEKEQKSEPEAEEDNSADAEYTVLSVDIDDNASHFIGKKREVIASIPLGWEEKELSKDTYEIIEVKLVNNAKPLTMILYGSDDIRENPEYKEYEKNITDTDYFIDLPKEEMNEIFQLMGLSNDGELEFYSVNGIKCFLSETNNSLGKLLVGCVIENGIIHTIQINEMLSDTIPEESKNLALYIIGSMVFPEDEGYAELKASINGDQDNKAISQANADTDDELIGYRDAGIYHNDYFGISYELPKDGWNFVEEEDIYDNAGDYEDDLRSILEKTGASIVMLAKSASELDNINIQIQDMKKSYGMVLTEDDMSWFLNLLEGSAGKTYEQLIDGYSAEETSIVDYEIGGRTISGIKIIGSFSGVKEYQISLFKPCGDYLMNITVTSFGEDNNDQMISCLK